VGFAIPVPQLFANRLATDEYRQTFRGVRQMSALPPKADIRHGNRDVRFVPKADILKRRAAGSSSAVQTSVEEYPGQQSLQPPAARMEVCPSPEWLRNGVAIRFT
jgi:hypothetical protein